MKRINEEKLEQMFRFINDYIDDYGISPKFDMIIDHMEMNNSVGYRYLLKLKERGLIEYNGRDSLAIKGKNTIITLNKRIKIFGTIPCGTPEDYKQEIQGYIILPEEWVDGECYLLKAEGDSMIDIGITEGDYVLIKRTSEAYNGQIIAALTENGTTLKRYMYDGINRPWLMAENKNYSKSKREMYPQHIEILGLAIKIIKDVK